MTPLENRPGRATSNEHIINCTGWKFKQTTMVTGVCGKYDISNNTIDIPWWNYRKRQRRRYFGCLTAGLLYPQWSWWCLRVWRPSVSRLLPRPTSCPEVDANGINNIILKRNLKRVSNVTHALVIDFVRPLEHDVQTYGHCRSLGTAREHTTAVAMVKAYNYRRPKPYWSRIVIFGMSVHSPFSIDCGKLTSRPFSASLWAT